MSPPGSNLYINNFENSQEQGLIEDLIIEAIKFYGIDLWYLPKTYRNRDQIYTEDRQSAFESAIQTVVYIKNNGFDGEGDFLSKFGVEIRDSIEVSIARRTFEEDIGDVCEFIRPREGDLMYFPLNNKIFEILFVEHEPVFYQMGSLQFYDLSLELYEYSNEYFETGISRVDDIMNKLSLDLFSKYTLSLEQQDKILSTEDDPQPIIVEHAVETDIDDVANSDNASFQEEGDEVLDFNDDLTPFSPDGRY